VKELQEQGYQVAIVSSGAINRGRKHAPKSIACQNSTTERQALSTLGQPHLMQDWQEAFGADHSIAQELIQINGAADHTFGQVLDTNLENGVVTIINYNDARNPLESEEDRMQADNDRLTMQVAKMMRPAHVMFLTGVDCVRNCHGQDIATIDLTDRIRLEEGAAEDQPMGTGGMVSKVQHGLSIVDELGCVVSISNSQTFHARELLKGHALATYILPPTQNTESH